ncbi:MAG: terminase large subunit [Amphiplicatus sp.]
MVKTNEPRRTGRAVWSEERGCWEDGSYWFDETTAAKACRFFPENLVFTSGPRAGEPFQLEPWEADDIIGPMFGWKRADGTRRYRRCYVWIAKKNGKTELAGGVALLIEIGDAELGGEVYSIASHGDQARIVFVRAGAMVEKSPTLFDHLRLLKNSIYCPALNASFIPLTGKAVGKHGLNVSGLIGDEIHEWRNGELYQYMHDNTAARAQPLEFLISTAGKKGTYGEEIYNECLAIIDGRIDDDETLIVIYAADPDDDWQAEETWRKANPNLGVSIKLEDMRAEARRALQIPRLENNFKNYKLNLWTEQAVRWLPIDSVDDDGQPFGWDHCKGPLDWRALEERLKGLTCFGGLDLASTCDLNALVWWFPIQEGLAVPACLARFWKPEGLVKQHAQRDQLPYERWVKEGVLRTMPGNVSDYAFIREEIYRDAERYKIAFHGKLDREDDEGGLAIDRFNATETTVKLQEEGVPVTLFGQGFASMSAPSKELERLVLSNGFHHGGQPLLREHAKVVSIMGPNEAGNIKPSRESNEKKKKHVDGIIALVMGIGLQIGTRREEAKPKSVWDQMANMSSEERKALL